MRPAHERYALEDARFGRVALVARVENLGDETVVLPYPGRSLERRPLDGETITLDPDDCTLRVTIEAPDGEVQILRSGFFCLFEPGGRDHLRIAPGGAETFRLDRFGPDFALACWRGIRHPVFTKGGVHRLRVRYQNRLPLAVLTTTTGPSYEQAWVGSLDADECELLVEP